MSAKEKRKGHRFLRRSLALGLLILLICFLGLIYLFLGGTVCLPPYQSYETRATPLPSIFLTATALDDLWPDTTPTATAEMEQGQ